MYVLVYASENMAKEYNDTAMGVRRGCPPLGKSKFEKITWKIQNNINNKMFYTHCPLPSCNFFYTLCPPL